ncbi:MAG: hypothetical protein VX834_04110 [Myxococcota bacterium]|nr:hypothetical protein [Myxococcota bacterium]
MTRRIPIKSSATIHLWCCVLGFAIGLGTAQTAFGYEDSTGTLVESVARAVIERARAQEIQTLSTVDIETRGAFDQGRFQTFFTRRLEEQLGFAGLVAPERGRVGQANLRIVVSVKSQRVWAVGFLEPTSGRAPIPLAISRVLDDELAYALGLRRTQGANRRWSIERMGVVRGQVLDICFVPIEGQGDETLLAVLTTDAVDFYRQPGLDDSLQQLSFRHELGVTRWPRIVAGWMGAYAPGKIWLATTAADEDPYVVDIESRERTRAPFVGVPVRQQDELGSGDVFFADRTPSSASLRGKLRLVGGQPVTGAPVMKSFRDAVFMARDNLWATVDADGRLAVSAGQGDSWDLGGERVGDRLVLTDLDDDEIFELVTTRASYQGEPDELMIRRVDVLSKRLISSFRRSTDGAIAALAVGRFHSEDGPAVWFVEQDSVGLATVWRVVMR